MEVKNDTVVVNVNALLSILKSEKWFIFGTILLSGIFAVAYSYTLKEEFKSEGKILPEIQGKSGSLGQFAGLAALAGVDMSTSGGADAVRPDLYPDVLKSTPFFLRLFQEKITDKDNKQMTFQAFYNSKVLDGKISKNDQNNLFPNSLNYISLSRQTESNIVDLKQRIVCSYDKKLGIIVITVKMPDPVVAANVTRFSMDFLTDYIIDYRTEKQKRDLDFLEDRLQFAKGKYFNSQSKKASYTDKMPLNALRLQSADLQRERIEAQYKTSSSFYNSLLQKYEEAKLKIQQETPVIKVLEPPVVANFKSEPKRSSILMFGIILGIVFSLMFVFLKEKNRRLIFSTI